MKSLKVTFNGLIKALKFLYHDEIVKTQKKLFLIRMKETVFLQIHKRFFEVTIL